MASEPFHPDADSAQVAWHELDHLAEGIAELASSDLPAGEFHAAVLQRVVSALAAIGGAVWTLGPGGRLHPEYQVNLPQPVLAEGSEAESGHRRIVEWVLKAGEARLVPPRSGPLGEDQAANPTEWLLVLCPWRGEDQSAGVIELLQHPGASPAAGRGYVGFLSAVCELVGDFHRNRQLRTFRRRVAHWGRFEQFVQRVHGSLDLKATAFQLANEGRRLVDCDRLSVAVRRGSRYRLLAVSGVDVLNRRANAVRHLERLAAVVGATGEPLWYPDHTEDLPPQIEQPLHAYLDESRVRTLAVVPLKPPETEQKRRRSRPLGVLVAEWFQGEIDANSRTRLDATSAHGALAMGNALELRGVPLLWAMRLLGKAGWFLGGGRLPKTLLVILAIAAAVVALVVVQADFEVEARGELQPVELRDVFAPSDGVVDELRTGHGKEVRAGEVLLVLHKPELDLEFQRIWGELQTAQKRLSAVEAERLRNPRETADERRRHSELTAEEEELKQLIGSLQRQYEIVQAQQAQLEVRSPVGGQVLTWNLRQLLEARPVQQGQVLMSVASLEGPWVLELDVPDDRIAYVLAAQREMGPELDVDYVVATEPGVTYRGKIEEVALRTQVTESDDSVVSATVGIDRQRMGELVPGATVVAKVHCGRRSLGYVWLHDLYEAVWSWIMF